MNATGRNITALTLTALLAHGPPAAASRTGKGVGTEGGKMVAIYVCTSSQGVRTYTDRGCLQGPRLELPPINIVDTSPATAPMPPASSTRPKRKKNEVNLTNAIKQACTEARAGLDALRERRRRGYRLRDSAMLDRREQELHAQRREHC